MKLYYVEHYALVKKRFAIIAENETILKEELLVRSKKLQSSKLSPTIDKISYELNPNWNSFVSLAWDGK